jgi:hypothetical protein
MDSKLLGSNIAWYSRYELIHETLRHAYKEVIYKEVARMTLDESEMQLLKSIVGESGDKVSYRSNKAEIESRLSEVGAVIYKILGQLRDHPSESMQTLQRVFSEQYRVEDSRIITRAKEEISAKSVQSPYDTDCSYRRKGEQEVKGYSINVTETCDTAEEKEDVTDADDSADGCKKKEITFPH